MKLDKDLRGLLFVSALLLSLAAVARAEDAPSAAPTPDLSTVRLLDEIPNHLEVFSHQWSGTLPADASLFEIVADFERRKIIESLEGANGSQTEAAESLHIPLSTLNQKIKRLNIEVRRKSPSPVP